MFGHVAIEFALCGLPKGFSREVPTMCFDGVARVSRAAAQLAFFVAVALDVYQGKAIWNVYIDSFFLNALPVPMLATVFFCLFSLVFFVFWSKNHCFPLVFFGFSFQKQLFSLGCSRLRAGIPVGIRAKPRIRGELFIDSEKQLRTP